MSSYSGTAVQQHHRATEVGTHSRSETAKYHLLFVDFFRAVIVPSLITTSPIPLAPRTQSSVIKAGLKITPIVRQEAHTSRASKNNILLIWYSYRCLLVCSFRAILFCRSSRFVSVPVPLPRTTDFIEN